MKTESLKHYIWLTLISWLTLSTGCVRDNNEPQPYSTVISLKARMEYEPETKTTLSSLADGKYYPLWAESDSIAVFTKQGQVPAPFRLISGEGETSAVFEGPRSGDRYVALFPYNSDIQWVGDELLFSLPFQQRYHAQSFALNGFPMVAVSDDGNLHFKNLCSIIRFPIRGSGVVRSISLHSDSSCLSGQASVSISYTGSPELHIEENGFHDVQLMCDAVVLNQEEAKDFYLVIPSGSYKDLIITIDAYKETVTKTISQEVVFKRTELRSVSPIVLEAPMIDLDNLPDNQIWYKTQSGKPYSPDSWMESQPFNAKIVSNTYENDYGILILDAPVKEIHEFAFNPFIHWPGNFEVTELHLPDCVERIGQQVLPYHLETFRVPGELKYIGSGNLYLVDSVYGPLVPDGHSIVKDGVLLGVADKGLEDYVTPLGVYKLETNSFDVSNIKNLTVSEGVREIADFAFRSASIETISFPESIEIIGNQSLSGVKRFEGSPHCISSDHLCLISPRSSYGPRVVSIVSGQEDEVYYVPEGVKLFSTVFENWPNLKKVYMPESLVDINVTPLFSECPSIEGLAGPGISEDGCCLISYGTLKYFFDNGAKEYTIPKEAQLIYAFNFINTGVEHLKLSEGVKELDHNCFEDAFALKTVEFPTTVTFIGNLAFEHDANLESIYLPIRIPPRVLGAPSSSDIPNLKVYVPEESYDTYMADPIWQGGWGKYLVPYHFDNIDPPAVYESSDYSQDGKVTVLQTATEGNGIDLILMGNDYSDRQIADGTYLATMEELAEGFFEVEPYRSFRHLFNVYAVNVVSKTEVGFPSNFVSNSLAYLELQFDKAFEYATKAIPDDRIDEATVAMVCNAPMLGVGYFGLCTMMYRNPPRITDYGSGVGVAVFPTTEMKALIKHEAGGHGFGKLDDEYTGGAVFPEAGIEDYRDSQARGYRINVDFTTDPTKVRWAKFLSDPRYAKERLGIYEGGGADFSYGIYRPSERSIMVDCQGGFNAPSREAIYYRIHKLAYGDEWQYDYEEFVKWDKGSGNIRPTSMQTFASGKKNYEVRDPLPVTKYNPDEWTVMVMK